MPKKAEEIVAEFAISGDSARSFLVTRPFFLRTKDGPAITVNPGQEVFLSPETGRELFAARKVEPTALGEIFEVIRPFRIDQGGEWTRLERGDIVKLSRSEALSLLREGTVREKKGGLNEAKGS